MLQVATTLASFYLVTHVGYGAFTPTFDSITFVTNYIGILPVIICYVCYKIIRRTKVVPLLEVGKLCLGYE